MKGLSRTGFIVLFQLFPVFLFAQNNSTGNQHDEGMDIFLLTLATIAVCTMIGAAIVGAFAATMTVFFLLGLFSLGLLSTSIAIGIYKRSFASGFKSLLVILFGSTCSIMGCMITFLLHYIIPISLSLDQLLLIGLISGTIGGIILGLSTYTFINSFLRRCLKKLELTNS